MRLDTFALGPGAIVIPCEKYPFCSSGFWRPSALLFEQGIGEHEQLAHHRGDGELGGFTASQSLAGEGSVA
jgi:hypothetical protein